MIVEESSAKCERVIKVAKCKQSGILISIQNTNKNTITVVIAKRKQKNF
jgi:hypothetical protein